MIKYNTKSWFRHILSFHKTDTIYAFRYELIIVALYAAGFAWIEQTYLQKYEYIFSKMAQFFSFIGFAFSMLLVFRINSAYDKWWEGRKMWGALVNNCRNFALKIKAFVPQSEIEAKDKLYDWMAAFPKSLKFHLRDEVEINGLPISDELKKVLFGKKHIPNAIAGEIYVLLKGLKDKKHLSEEEMLMLDKEVKSLTDILGACERIKSTPIPYSYNMFLKKLILVFILLTPLAFVEALHYWTIGLTVLVFYIFVGLEYISEEIEEPFGTDNNDLPLDDLANKILENITEIRS
ncbi:MAG: bestrophin family ion channel [Crocinitomicaceae bacterium]